MKKAAERGASLIEAVMLMSLVSLIAIGSTHASGQNMTSVFSMIIENLQSGTPIFSRDSTLSSGGGISAGFNN